MCHTYAVITLTTENPGTCGFERYQDRHCQPYCAEVITQKLLQIFKAQCQREQRVIVGDGATDEEAHADTTFISTIKLNTEKFRLRLSSVSYMRHLHTREGLRPDPQKVKAIVVNYLSRFMPNMTDMCEPLHQLTQQSNDWQWSYVQEAAFNKLKQAKGCVPVLIFFAAKKEVIIHRNSSDAGLGATLLQEGQPVAYASRALMNTKCNYVQNREEVTSYHICL